jgi:hypothetical protein
MKNQMIKESSYKAYWLYSRILILIFSLTVACSACNASEKTLVTTSSCSLPCWNEIIPGETSKQDFFEIINNMPTVHENPIQLYSYSGEFSDAIRFRVHINKFIRGPDVETIFFQEKVVKMDFFRNIGLTMEKTIEKFGIPDYVVVEYFHPEVKAITFTIIYPTKGLLFEYGLKSNTSEIDPKDNITHVNAFDPNLFQQMLNAGLLVKMGNNKPMYEFFSWKGYGVIKEKYWSLQE